MIMNKRGLSQVVTTVLIILLVLVAILIIWGFVRPTIESTGEQVTADCLQIDLRPTACTIATTSVTVERGADNADLQKIRLVFFDGTTADVDGTALGALESETFDSTDLPGFTIPVGELRVAAIVGANQQVCPASTISKDCE